MAVNRKFKHPVYGLKNGTQGIAPDPVIARRDPTDSDLCEISTLWVNVLTDSYFILTSVTNGVSNWQAQQTGSGTFSSVDITGGVGTVLTVDAGGNTLLGGDLAVSGDSVMTGGLIVNGAFVANGDFDITDSASISLTSTNNAAQAIYLHANGGTSETIEVRSDQGTGLNSVYLLSDVGGVLVEAAGSTNNKAINLLADSGGVQIDAVKASAVNVVGAAQDLSLNATGGSINLTATEAASDAIVINASDAAGKVAITGVGGVTVASTNATIGVTSGTGAINIGADAVAHTVTIGNVTGASVVAINAGTAGAGAVNIATTANATPVTIGNVTGATSVTVNTGTGGFAVNTTGAGDVVVTSADTVLIDAAGVLELNSSAGVISVGNDAVAQNINVGTGAAARTITIGNNTGASAVSIQAGTAGAGAINIGTTANAVPVTIGNVTGATSVAINSGTGGVAVASTGAGDITLASADTLLLDSAGVLELNSSAGAISIGNDAVAALINIGTGASNRDITIGNTTASTTITLNTPTSTQVSIPQGIDIGVKVISGTGSPNGAVSAAVGSLFLRQDPAGATSRIYVNTDGATAWTNVTCAA